MKLTFPLNVRILFCLFFLLLVSCNEDEVVDKQEKEETEKEEIEEEGIVGEEEIVDDPADFALNFNLYKGEVISIELLLVKVIDELGEPIDFVNVSVGGLNDQTDSKGVILFNNVSAFKNFLTAKISKTGYISTVKTIIPTEGLSQILEVTLLKPDVVKQINSGQEASVSTPSGAEVVLNGNYFNADGSSYTGVVNVSLKHLSPENETTYSNMPGNLLAQDTNGQVKLLETYGMLAVELTGSGGEQLNVNTENKATITLPIALSQQAFSEDSIPLWYFDEDQGIWVEEGSADKQVVNYVGEVSHFSWWNCDVPINLVNMCLTVEDSENNVLPNQKIKIIRNETDQIIYTGFTDSYGKLCVVIPKDEFITIQVFRKLSCTSNDVLFERSYGKYNEEFNELVAKIDDESVGIYSVKGKITDCYDVGIKGVFEITIKGLTSVFFTENDGTFNYSFPGCEADIVTLVGYDIGNQKATESQVLKFTDKIANLGSIQTCEKYSDVYKGDVILASQEELNAFGALGYKVINGNLYVVSNSPNYNPTFSGVITDNITDLSGLKDLVQVTEGFFIKGNSGLTSLEGLTNLSTVDDRFRIIDNKALSSLYGLNSLEKLHSLDIGNNQALTNLKGLENLNIVTENIWLSKNSDLIDLTGLENLISIGGLTINENPNLISLEVLSGLATLDNGNLIVNDNDSLTSLSGLEGLSSVAWDVLIRRNDAITDLSGLDGLSYVGGDMQIGAGNTDQFSVFSGNASLNSLNGLESLTTVGGGLVIGGNITLTSLSGLENLTEVEGVSIGRNPLLKDLTGLNSLNSIGVNLVIRDNDGLINLKGLESLPSINGTLFLLRNKALTSLTGLENIKSFGTYRSLSIQYNRNLTDYCALSNAIISGIFDVTGNAYNPTLNQLSNPDECSQ